MMHTAHSDANTLAHAGESIEAIRQRAIGKAAWRLLPLLALGFFFNFLDRTSIGFAALTMNRQLGLSATQFGLGAGIMFAAYCVCEVPSNLGLYRFGARRWIARIMISWGIAAAGTAFATGPTSFYALRLLLGAAEAGFFPGVVYFLTLWFPKRYRTSMLGWFTVSIPLSAVIGGPVSAWLLHLDNVLGLAGWQWMLIAEGLPTCVLGLVALKVLSDRPSDAHWLTHAEKDALNALLDEERAVAPRTHRFSHALKDYRVYWLALICFSYTLGSYGVALWLPQILRSHGLTLMQTGWFAAAPYAFAAIGLLLWSALVDRSGRAVAHLVLACLLTSVGMVLSVRYASLASAMIGITVALICVTAARAIFFTLPQRLLSGEAAAGGLALVSSIGVLGGFAGPYLVGRLKDLTGSFQAGMIAMAIFLAIAAAMASVLPAMMRRG
jgi:MFS family permease